jgi:hypothetical protein
MVSGNFLVTPVVPPSIFMQNKEMAQYQAHGFFIRTHSKRNAFAIVL